MTEITTAVSTVKEKHYRNVLDHDGAQYYNSASLLVLKKSAYVVLDQTQGNNFKIPEDEWTVG